MTREVYEGMTLASLKEIAKELNIKNISKYKKSELIDEIIENKVNSIEKDGVILKEKIAPKVRNNTNNYQSMGRVQSQNDRNNIQGEKQHNSAERKNYNQND